MEGRIRVWGERKPEPNIRLYVLALLALMRQLEEEERQAADTSTPAPATPDEERAHD
jgi:hypothetical protein